MRLPFYEHIILDYYVGYKAPTRSYRMDALFIASELRSFIGDKSATDKGATSLGTKQGSETQS